MKTMKFSLSLVSIFIFSGLPCAVSDEKSATQPPLEKVKPELQLQENQVVLTPEEPTASFVVFIPEQIDTVWHWYHYTDRQSCIVQAAVEKALIDAGYEVIDLSTANIFNDRLSVEDVASPREAVKKAKALGATYAIVGKAVANQRDNRFTGGVQVTRSGAEAHARIIRVNDGKVVGIEAVSAPSGGLAQKSAAQGALAEVGTDLGRALCSRINLMLAP